MVPSQGSYFKHITSLEFWFETQETLWKIIIFYFWFILSHPNIGVCCSLLQATQKVCYFFLQYILLSQCWYTEIYHRPHGEVSAQSWPDYRYEGKADHCWDSVWRGVQRLDFVERHNSFGEETGKLRNLLTWKFQRLAGDYLDKEGSALMRLKSDGPVTHSSPFILAIEVNK